MKSCAVVGSIALTANLVDQGKELYCWSLSKVKTASSPITCTHNEELGICIKTIMVS